jgi:hypothetical protein
MTEPTGRSSVPLRSCIEAVWKIAALTARHLESTAKRKPPAVKHLPRYSSGRVRKFKKTACQKTAPRKLLLSRSLDLPRRTPRCVCDAIYDEVHATGSTGDGCLTVAR